MLCMKTAWHMSFIKTLLQMSHMKTVSQIYYSKILQAKLRRRSLRFTKDFDIKKVIMFCSNRKNTTPNDWRLPWVSKDMTLSKDPTILLNRSMFQDVLLP